MPCSTCPPAANCDGSLLCDPIVVDTSCCCPPKPILATVICPTKVCEVLNCEVDNRSAFFIPNNPDGRGLACACVCLPEGVTFTATQKAAIVKLLDGVMQAIVPSNWQYCCDTGDFRQHGGHTFALKPPSVPFQPNATGQYVQVAVIDPTKPVQYFPDPAASCCADSAHSPFVRGDSITYDVGMGRPHFFTDRDLGSASGVGISKIAETFCCAKDAINAA